MKKTIKSILCIAMIAFMVFTAANVSALTTQRSSAYIDCGTTENLVTVEKCDPNEIVPIIVKLKDQPILAVAENGTKKAGELRSELLAKQDKVVNEINSLTKSSISVKYHYVMLFNGFSFEGEYRLIDEIKSLPGVADCYRSEVYALPDDIDEEDTRLSSSVGYINADDLWSLGYTGQGQTIAIIDTGIKKTHSNFSTAPTDPHFSESSIQSILDGNELCAEQRYNGTLSGSNLYYSAKIPYTFNYVTGTTDVGHSTANSDHGTHVSSIAAGYDTTVKGVAYNAQIVSMQVFNNGEGEWVDILAALEDCVYLQVDALNMSLGSDCGFSTSDEDVELVYALLAQTGINAAVAAGNSEAAGSGNNFNGNQPTFNIDNGVVSDPGSLYGSLCVASSEKNNQFDPSSFSSWGSTSDLRIKPEIMAPGGSIYAATDSGYSYSNYGTKSGTSMATPHIAGSMALVHQYVNANFPNLSAAERTAMVNTLLMSTAVPSMVYTTPRSVRLQGAGQADLIAAISTKAYLDVEGCSRPKLELGDDPERTGIFDLSFDVVNFGSTALTYTVDVFVTTEGTNTGSFSGQSGYYMTNSPYNITDNVDITKPTTITVPAGQTVTVNVTIDVNRYAASLDEKFPVGAYIEGYVRLMGDVNLTMPYLGFYGDWHYASVFDRAYYYDAYLGNTTAYPAEWGINSAGSSIGSSYVEFGMNPFTTTENFLLDRASISPNGDGKMDAIDTVYTYLLRNCGVFEYSIYDAETGEEYFNLPIPWERKCYENSWYVTPRPVGYYDSNAITPWYAEGIEDGTTVILRMTGYLDSFREFDPEDNENAVWEIPVTIDRSEPEIVYWNLQDGELLIYVRDNHYVSYVGAYSNASCTTLIDGVAVEENQRGMMSMISLNVGNRDQVYVKVGDYAYNFITQSISGEGGSLEPIDLEGICINEQNAEVFEGSSTTLNIVRTPIDANNFTMAWTSSNENIATVSGGLTKATVTGVSEGTVTITATATDKRTNEVFTATATVIVNDYPSLDEALNASGFNFHFNSSGSYAWEIDMIGDRVAGKSTNQENASSQSTVTMDSITLSAGDKLRFDWLVSSESNYDFLKFYVNGSMVQQISGEVGWTTVTYTVPSDGNYIFKWSYEKDGSVNRNEDTGWVDEVRIEYVNPPEPVNDGDVNRDGYVDIQDAILVLRHAMSISELTAEQQLIADVNGDGFVNTSDAVMIERIAMGIAS